MGFLGLVSDIFGGIQKNNALGRAGTQLLTANQRARDTLTGAQQNAYGTLREGQQEAYDTAFNTLQGIAGENAPYIGVGQQALLGLGAASQAQTPFQAPTAADIKAQLDPSMQFTMEQGLQALQRSAAGRGRLYAGGTLKDIEQFAQGLASTQYGQAYNRAFQTSLANYQSGMENQANLFNRQYSLAGMGYGAGSQVNQARQNFANNVIGVDVGTGQQIARNQLGLGSSLADLNVDEGNIRAAQTMGKVGNVVNSFQNGLYNLGAMWDLAYPAFKGARG